VGFGSYGGYLLYKRRKDKPVPPSAAVEEVVEPDIAQLGDKDINITISFPQIENDLPDVWGLNDGLNIELLLTDRLGNGMAQKDIEVYIEKAMVGKFLADDRGKAKLVQTFSNKGEHSVVVKFNGDQECESIQGTRKIRIVDYREEIVVLFNALLAMLLRCVKIRHHAR
jgi:hypothetical protein